MQFFNFFISFFSAPIKCYWKKVVSSYAGCESAYGPYQGSIGLEECKTRCLASTKLVGGCGGVAGALDSGDQSCWIHSKEGFRGVPRGTNYWVYKVFQYKCG